MGLSVEAANLLKHLPTTTDVKEAQDEVAQSSKGSGSLTRSAGIFSKDGVTLMVRAVLNLPVTSPVAVELLSLGKRAGKGIFNLLANFTGSLSESQKAAKGWRKGEGKGMRPPSPTKGSMELTDETTRAMTVERLQEHLELDIQGSKATTEMALEVLLHAASTGQSIEASCAELVGTADSNTLREYLNEHFHKDNLTELEEQVNSALSADIVKKVRLHPRELALDLHDQAFYGKDKELLSFACRSQAKAGTTYFFRIASAYVMQKGVRMTLGVVFVRPQMSLKELVSRLTERVRAQGVTVSSLYLDRGFASIPVYQYLLESNTPAVIACPIRGKQGGTKALCQGRQSYLTQHTFCSAEHGECTVKVAVVRSFTHKGKRGDKKRRKARWFIYLLIHSKFKAQQAHARYRSRFGIESSYRSMRQLRIRSNSRNPAMRFLFMALGLILVNVWLALRFRFCQIPRQGRSGRPLDEARFRLKRFASFLRHAIERRYSWLPSITATALPIGV